MKSNTEMGTRRPSVIYVISDNRSGSTLLDQLLGAHPEMRSVGEVHHLAAYALRDRSLYDPNQPLDCACGKSLDQCPFWTSVERQLDRPLQSLRLRFRLIGSSSNSPIGKLRRLPRRFIERFPRTFCTGLAGAVFATKRVARDSFELVDAIGRVTGARYIVDSSKSAFRFRALHDFAPDRTRAIILARDYRAIAYSKMKRGRSLASSMHGWVARMREMSDLTADIPADHLFRLRHEDLCARPESTMTSICEFLKLNYSEAMLSRPASDNHNLGGSPSKFDPQMRQIRLDDSYRTAFTDEQLAYMKDVAEEFASRWSYD